MAAFAGRRLIEMADNTSGIIAIELLAACQGVDFRAPLKTSPLLERARKGLRRHVPFYDRDRYFAPDIKKVKKLVKAGTYNTLIGKGLLPSL
jgi:histidine ammonia-lyase